MAYLLEDFQSGVTKKACFAISPSRMKFICLFVILYFVSSLALADSLHCELTYSSQTEKSSDEKFLSLQVDPYTCRAVKEDGDMIHMRITSSLNSDKVDEAGYRSVSETLYNVDIRGDGLDYATCTCTLK